MNTFSIYIYKNGLMSEKYWVKKSKTKYKKNQINK